MSASAISRQIGAKRSEVNSILYQYKGDLFRKIGSSPPLWSGLGSSSVGPYQDEHLHRSIGKNLHIDFPGGDWVISIQITDGSRNDPLVESIRRGPRLRDITVSRHVFSSREHLSSNGDSDDAVIAIAASTLVWEMFKELPSEDQTSFEWGEALRDVYLSLASSIRSKPAE